jgi:hypothetical protein
MSAQPPAGSREGDPHLVSSNKSVGRTNK